MASFARHVEVVWNGGLMDGKGSAKAGTGAFDLPVTFLSRVGEPEGHTSPEELIAAAHASCFSMALAFRLTSAGSPPAELRTESKVEMIKEDAGWKITKSALTVRAKVPGIDATKFAELAADAKANCPVSKALGALEITLDAALE